MRVRSRPQISNIDVREVDAVTFRRPRDPETQTLKN